MAMAAYAARHYGADGLALGQCTGNIFNGFTFSGISFTKGMPYLGKAQFFADTVRIRGNFFKGFDVQINNGMMTNPLTGSVVFYGLVGTDSVDLSFYSGGFGIKDVLGMFFKNSPFVSGLSGQAKDIDISLSGSFKSPAIKGSFIVHDLTYKDFSASDMPVFLDIAVRDGSSVYGEISVSRGTISGHKTATMAVKEGRVMYAGDPLAPSYRVVGQALVDDVSIDMLLTGTRKKPSLRLSSDPQRPQGDLLLMLLTGRKWDAVYNGLAGDGLSTSIAADALDYFVFGGSGRDLVKALGVDFSMNLKGNSTTVTIKKNIGDKMTAGYEITQEKQKDGAAGTTHAVSGEYKVTDNVSLEAQSDLLRVSNAASGQEAERKMMLKYQRSF